MGDLIVRLLKNLKISRSSSELATWLYFPDLEPDDAGHGIVDVGSYSLKIGALWRREHVHAALTKKLKTFQRWMD